MARLCSHLGELAAVGDLATSAALTAELEASSVRTAEALREEVALFSPPG